MEAIGDQLAESGRSESGGSANMLSQALRGDRRQGAYDAGARLRLHGRLHAVPASTAEPQPVAVPAIEELPGLAGIGNLLAAAAVAARDALASADYVEAAGFAGQVEDLSRTVEYLQLVAAAAVDRTRGQAITAAAAARTSQGRTGRRPGCTGRAWVTGWDATGVETLNETDANWPSPPAQTAAAEQPGSPATSPAAVASPADDGCRNTAEFLRLRLRIPIREARRRLALARQALPGTTLTGEPVPPARGHLAAALTPTNAPTGNPAEVYPDPCPPAGPVLSSHAATIITATLDRLQHHTSTETLDRIEHHLTTTAVTADPDFLTRLAQRWTDTIDADPNKTTTSNPHHHPTPGNKESVVACRAGKVVNYLAAIPAATVPATTVPTTTVASSSSERAVLAAKPAAERIEAVPAACCPLVSIST